MTEGRRFSIPYVSNPARRAEIEPLPELAAGQRRYRSFGWMDFMRSRNADNYADLGSADAQISDFRIGA